MHQQAVSPSSFCANIILNRFGCNQNIATKTTACEFDMTWTVWFFGFSVCLGLFWKKKYLWNILKIENWLKWKIKLSLYGPGSVNYHITVLFCFFVNLTEQKYCWTTQITDFCGPLLADWLTAAENNGPIQGTNALNKPQGRRRGWSPRPKTPAGFVPEVGPCSRSHAPSGSLTACQGTMLSVTSSASQPPLACWWIDDVILNYGKKGVEHSRRALSAEGSQAFVFSLANRGLSVSLTFGSYLI